MARLFVTSDDRSVRVEIDHNEIDGTYQAFCLSPDHAPGPTPDVIAGERCANGSHPLSDVVEVVSRHADQHRGAR
jgi:hypothetical protein